MGRWCLAIQRRCRYDTRDAVAYRTWGTQTCGCPSPRRPDITLAALNIFNRRVWKKCPANAIRRLLAQRPTLIADHKAPLVRSAEPRCHRIHTPLKGQRDTALKEKPSGRYTERLFFASPGLLALSLASNLVSQTCKLVASVRLERGVEAKGAVSAAVFLGDR